METQPIDLDQDSETWSDVAVRLTLQELITSITHLYDAMPSDLDGRCDRLESILLTLGTCQLAVLDEWKQTMIAKIDEVKF